MVNREQVIWAYRLLLEREPESELVISEKLNNKSLGDLINEFLSSPEYRRLNGVSAYGIEYYFTPYDVSLLESIKIDNLKSKDGYIINFMGTCIDCSFFPNTSNRSGEIISQLPIPDDTLHAEAFEYISLIEGINSVQNNREVAIVEIGAGWGPWIVNGALIAKRQNKSARLLAVEMLSDKITHLFAHLNNNEIYTGIDKSVNIWHHQENNYIKVVHGAVAQNDGIMYAPLVNGSSDHGARPSVNQEKTDYRGLEVSYEGISSYSLSTLLQDLPVVDFMHVDIQGFEYQIISESIQTLQKKVRYLFIGTHSRKIEGDLFSLLYDAGWILLREKPCTFRFEKGSTPTLEGLVIQDGGQQWQNPFLD